MTTYHSWNLLINLEDYALPPSCEGKNENQSESEKDKETAWKKNLWKWNPICNCKENQTRGQSYWNSGVITFLLSRTKKQYCSDDEERQHFQSNAVDGGLDKVKLENFIQQNHGWHFTSTGIKAHIYTFNIGNGSNALRTKKKNARPID